MAAGKVTSTRIPAVSVPGKQSPWSDILDEFPELTDEVRAMTSWRDVNQHDRRSADFDKIFPSMKPMSNGKSK